MVAQLAAQLTSQRAVSVDQRNKVEESVLGCINENNPGVAFTTRRDLSVRAFQTLNFVHFCDEQKNIRKVKDLEITAAGGPALLVARELPTAELV